MSLKEQLEVTSHVANNEQVVNFTHHINKQTFNQTIYKNWQQKCINKMDKIRERIAEDCQRHLRYYYYHEKNGAKLRDELQRSINKLQDDARQIANELLRKKETETGQNITPEFSDDEIERKFEIFWRNVKEKFNSEKEKTFDRQKMLNVRHKFATEIALKYGLVARFRKIFDKFGVYRQNKFKIEWVKFSDVEFIGNVTYRQYNKHVGISETEFFQNMWELIVVTESKLLDNVIGLCNYGGLIKMQFQSDSVIFDGGTLVKQYLPKAMYLLVETHENSQQKGLYNLTDTFKTMFSFIAAQLAVPKFEKAQRSFIDYMDISKKLDSKKENTKQIFTLILRKELLQLLLNKLLKDCTTL